MSDTAEVMHLREQKAAARKLREALDDLPPLAWTTLARECARKGHSLEELYKFLDSLDERIDRMLVNEARKPTQE